MALASARRHGDDSTVTGLAGPGCLRDARELSGHQVRLALVLHVHRDGDDDTELRRVFGRDGGRVTAVGAAGPLGILVALLGLDRGGHAVHGDGGCARRHGVADVPRERNRATGARHRFGLVDLGEAVAVGRHLRVDLLVREANRIRQRVRLRIEQERPLAGLDDQVTVAVLLDGGAVVVGDRVGLHVDGGHGGSGRLRERARQAERGQDSEEGGTNHGDIPFNWEVAGDHIFAQKRRKVK